MCVSCVHTAQASGLIPTFYALCARWAASSVGRLHDYDCLGSAAATIGPNEFKPRDDSNGNIDCCSDLVGKSRVTRPSSRLSNARPEDKKRIAWDAVGELAASRKPCIRDAPSATFIQPSAEASLDEMANPAEVGWQAGYPDAHAGSRFALMRCEASPTLATDFGSGGPPPAVTCSAAPGHEQSSGDLTTAPGRVKASDARWSRIGSNSRSSKWRKAWARVRTAGLLMQGTLSHGVHAAVRDWIAARLVKSPLRAATKAAGCYGGDLSRLLDVCRARAVFSSVDALTACLRMAAAASGVRIVRVKNFMEEESDSWWTAGFRVRK